MITECCYSCTERCGVEGDLDESRGWGSDGPCLAPREHPATDQSRGCLVDLITGRETPAVNPPGSEAIGRYPGVFERRGRGLPTAFHGVLFLLSLTHAYAEGRQLQQLSLSTSASIDSPLIGHSLGAGIGCGFGGCSWKGGTSGGLNNPIESLRILGRNGKQFLAEGGGAAIDDGPRTNTYVRGGLDSDFDGFNVRSRGGVNADVSAGSGGLRGVGNINTNLVGPNLVPVANVAQFSQVSPQVQGQIPVISSVPTNPAGVVISLNNNPAPQMQVPVQLTPVLTNPAQYVQQYNPQALVQPAGGTPYMYNPQNPANVFATAASTGSDGSSFQPAHQKARARPKQPPPAAEDDDPDDAAATSDDSTGTDESEAEAAPEMYPTTPAGPVAMPTAVTVPSSPLTTSPAPVTPSAPVAAATSAPLPVPPTSPVLAPTTPTPPVLAPTTPTPPVLAPTSPTSPVLAPATPTSPVLAPTTPTSPMLAPTPPTAPVLAPTTPTSPVLAPTTPTSPVLGPNTPTSPVLAPTAPTIAAGIATSTALTSAAVLGSTLPVSTVAAPVTPALAAAIIAAPVVASGGPGPTTESATGAITVPAAPAQVLVPAVPVQPQVANAAAQDPQPASSATIIPPVVAATAQLPATRLPVTLPQGQNVAATAQLPVTGTPLATSAATAQLPAANPVITQPQVQSTPDAPQLATASPATTQALAATRQLPAMQPAAAQVAVGFASLRKANGGNDITSAIAQATLDRIGLGQRDALAEEMARSINPDLGAGPLAATSDAQSLALAETLVKSVARAYADGGNAANVADVFGQGLYMVVQPCADAAPNSLMRNCCPAIQQVLQYANKIAELAKVDTILSAGLQPYPYVGECSA